MNRRKRVSKKPILLAILTLAILLGIAKGIIAYGAMFVSEEKQNHFRIGNVTTKIINVVGGSKNVVVGQSIKQNIEIQNAGDIRQFIRILVHPEIQKKATAQAVPQILPSKIGDQILLKLNDKYWKDGEDGYFYYLNALNPKQKTESVLTELKLNSNLPAIYQEATLTLSIKIESINTVKNAYREAWWNGQIPTEGAKLAIDHHLKAVVTK